jgi:hypothetical protein
VPHEGFFNSFLGWEVYENERAANAAVLGRRAVLNEQGVDRPLFRTCKLRIQARPPPVASSPSRKRAWVARFLD